MSFEDKFKLKTNPFRIVPAMNPNELIWAGLPKLKEKIEQRIMHSIKIPNSSLILNWGEYGSGKTHASKYFSKKDVLKDIAQKVNSTIPISYYFLLPKSKNPIHEIFTSFIDKIDIKDIRNVVKTDIESIDYYLDGFCDNLQLKSVAKAIFKDEIDSLLLKKYLYGNATQTDLKVLSEQNILRSLNTDNDYIQLIACIFSVLTYNKKYYSHVILWIDEYEDIAVLPSSTNDKINSFLRGILENTPNNLLIFLNLTQTAFFAAEDLSQYISDSVKSRIKDRIHFGTPTTDDLLLYTESLLNHRLYRTEPTENKYFPFTKDLITEIQSDINDPSIRQINEAFSLLLELADMENSEITIDFYEKYKSEIIGWKE